MQMSQVLRFYVHSSGHEGAASGHIQRKLKGKLTELQGIETELCYNVNWTAESLPNSHEIKKLEWLFGCPLESDDVARETWLLSGPNDLLLEVGPRLNFSSPASTNIVSVCWAAGLRAVDRVETTRRYRLTFTSAPSAEERAIALATIHDQMTEQCFPSPIQSFSTGNPPASCNGLIDILAEGRTALEKANKELGLAMDSWDLDFYTCCFQELKRNPSIVEAFDLAQSNSEHSRHWFFKGRLWVDGQELEHSLFDAIMSTQATSNPNNVIKFCDNSSAIQGQEVQSLCPEDPSKPSRFQEQTGMRHVIFTAETHNFPTGVAPFSGATTGTGGRIRDVQCTGKGAHVVAGTAGYCFGNLHIPGYSLPWEEPNFQYPRNFAHPLEVAIEASNGASDYGNKFGEPVLAGFARSFGLCLPNGQRREWIKPIMFTGGIGSINAEHVNKEAPEQGMEVVKVGGPVYRIGLGGGAASSIQVQGDNASDLDFGAVQRGDPEMEQKMNRVIRACIEAPGGNPICSLHDQGAGGNGNVLKELSDPAGARIYTSRFQLGDPTLNALEIWGAEYQESNALLTRSSNRDFMNQVCSRERCPVSYVGTITGDGRIVLVDDRKCLMDRQDHGDEPSALHSTPVDLKLDWVLGKMPKKDFFLERVPCVLQPLVLPPQLRVRQALDRVLRLPAVASKRYLTNKVDRSVGGLVAQQQCVGPLHTPLADVAVVALSHRELVGAATALGEQPIKSLLDPRAAARLAVAEALTNLVFAQITDLRDVKCSGNWMWPAKLPGDGVTLVDACVAMVAVMRALGVAVDGGKDSLSMAARVGDETVRAPGSLVISAYAVCPDIMATVTPDLKNPGGQGRLLYVPLSPGQHRLGGTALAQCFSQLGTEPPDLDVPENLVGAFNVTQGLLKEHLLSSGHDVSDGGLITCILEMAFAGNCGIEVDLPFPGADVLSVLFAEELGLVFEVQELDEAQVQKQYQDAGLTCLSIGRTAGNGPHARVQVAVNGTVVLEETVGQLRALWEETSFQLERLQAEPSCVNEEEAGLRERKGPCYSLPPFPTETSVPHEPGGPAPRVAILREEGSNGDREMADAFHMAGFEVWDVTMQDLCSGAIGLDTFQGVAFVGGFSYADVLGSAKGWAAAVTFNAHASTELQRFRRRTDTFSLGVCNGCQLLALLGWVGRNPNEDEKNPTPNTSPTQPGLLLRSNISGRFESRWATVRVGPGPALMLRGMEGGVLPVWSAHGEGYMAFSSPELQAQLEAEGLVPLHWVDDDGNPTDRYPWNPNGSPGGVAGVCSQDGRHLALMPHPERAVRPWQWAWRPPPFDSLSTSPWLQLFTNARRWCQEGN
ncbi:phosphoribosylformylglycinamidine synthase isoform X1 [Dromiciops gliroides]|uniref:phosphoribosylformylglycinamidine synthase isoform X1 n=1 Tax=Dromiciops gliroides TaxID=33562 RepID=UPI001CC7958C|nr:phosphoribosylformylglycinamidine synthase isoform X1 [Dromiciops gliroides]XP_043820512.1 phosphoribosylformylglycinamidine synthase isoform X1 [Dromiciops gliroides]XP_043820513.1 phosphoribosylformylglycinamidine synthase isoform X1 [Dromiciops gliroides]XP_043820514.1 phosphoribosylformylglycinamidine synthase isoform X1 [Dromiciops gliroides]